MLVEEKVCWRVRDSDDECLARLASMLTSFMSYDLGYFDEDACRLEPIANPFAAKACSSPGSRLQRSRGALCYLCTRNAP